MTEQSSADQGRVVIAERVVRAAPETIFEQIADPANQPRWDGNDNLSAAEQGQRVHAVGDVFTMQLTNGQTRENRIVEFEEGGLVAWLPSPVGEPAPGHLWRWQLEPLDDGTTLVRHSYDWTRLTDPHRFERARATTKSSLLASIDRLAVLVEQD